MTDASNVAAGSPLVTGGILAGPLGTTLPTTAKGALDAALKALGYAGDSGIEPSGDTASKKDVVAWGGDTVASLSEKKATRKYKFTLIEAFSADVNEFVYGAGNVTVTAASGTNGTRIAITDKAEEPGFYALVFDMKYGGKRKRGVIPNGSVSILAERPYVDSDVTGWDCEVTCIADGNGDYVLWYLEDDDAPGV